MQFIPLNVITLICKSNSEDIFHDITDYHFRPIHPTHLYLGFFSEVNNFFEKK